MVKQDLEVYRGDNETFSITVKRSNTVYPLTSVTIWFTAKNDVLDADASAVIRKDTLGLGGITITDAPAGKFDLNLIPTDTASITVPTTVNPKDRFEYFTELYYDIQLKTGGGAIFTIAEGRLLVKPDVTQAVS